MPSILNGLFSGRAGLASHGLAISVVGDNLSNASTIGYKASRAEFADMVSAGQPSERLTGSGSQIQSIVALQEQGTLEFTNRTLDVAIEGQGYFTVDAKGSNVYTRSGNFRVDEDGFLVTQQGDNVLGFRTSGTGGLESLNVTSILQDNVTTGEVQITGNLDAAAAPTAISATVNSIPTAQNVADGTTTPATTDPTFADINAEADFSTVVNVFDSLGEEHNISLFFFKTSATAPQYTVKAYGASEDIDSGSGISGYPRLLTSADGSTTQVDLSFDSNGAISLTSDTELTVDVPWNNGSSEQQINFDLAKFTQFSANSSVTAVTQDGQGVGNVTSLNIGSDGEIFAVLDTAQTATIGHLALTNFFNPEGLRRIGENYLQETNSSGEPIVGKPDSGRLGSLQAGSLELSTVDIANEFVKLVTLQRAFQANSRMVTTVNSLLQEIIQLV
jgi:flagellar hook protein FlgE